MSGFIDTRLPECVAYGFQGGPEWNTAIVELDNGGEVRNGQWRYPRMRYSAAFNNLSAAGQREVMAAFYAARGRLYAFRFNDPLDNVAKAEPIAPAIGTTDAVQLTRTYRLGPESATRRIQAIVTAVIRNSAGTAVAGSLDAGKGLFVPALAWADDDYTWSGEFDVWVRFDSDHNAFTLGDLDAHSADIELVEVRR
ncbi:hypothetical protein ATCM_01075 [Stenotrophomonas sp. ATCM1_4]|uniref:DUF2460 domain-containing protein n=1 Tax=Stenotrophomonas sp. ATCM1_4 TaxID=2259330 RepID=UPI001049D0A6|nr:DUF2460 domain-containing protein [Stenotrophomonas sp. ATCM1_4]TDB26379.1 hypothetical protein ATCM_01075 [Stenotrophomonas sp. ATCM1_4]